MKMRFTEKSIDAIEHQPGEQSIVWDEEVTGFGVRLNQNGTKTFVLKYRLKTGRVRWKKLGRVGAISLIKARAFAKEDIGIVARGGDPLEAKDSARDAVTVAAAVKDFLEWVEGQRSGSTFRNYTRACEDFIVPRLGTLAIAEVTRTDVVRLHYRLRATPVQANRVLACLSSLMTWSMTFGYREAGHNPCFLVERNPERKRKVYLDADQYATLGKALKGRGTSISRAQRVAIELLLLTGARPAEIASAQWPNVTYLPDGTGRLVLPEHKTDETAGEKSIQLPKAAVALLKSWPRHARSPYLFPGTGRGPGRKGKHMHACTLSDAWAKLRKDHPQLAGVRLYDACRHSWASEGISVHGLTLAQVGGQLGHSQPATTDRYAHLHDKVARANADLVGGSIAKALRGKRAR
jgi:integrase